MGMIYQKAQEIMDFLLSCGINAEYQTDVGNSIIIYDDDAHFLFSIDDDEEWEALKKIFLAIAGKLKEEEQIMGCDIHGVVEIFHQGEWKPTMDIAAISPRNYVLFAELFGVRGRSSLEKDYGGRGFPTNVSWQTQYIFCDECEGDGHYSALPATRVKWKGQNGKDRCDGRCADWHSVSYITIQEIEQHRDEIMQWISKESYQQEWHVVFDSMRFWSKYLANEDVVVESSASLSTGKEDTSRVRLIVWFDN